MAEQESFHLQKYGHTNENIFQLLNDILILTYVICLSSSIVFSVFCNFRILINAEIARCLNHLGLVDTACIYLFPSPVS